ncbi:hypothetical protein [Brevibacillus brevis]|uniref:hypothetical protein n=1 Tax=Brevibacillus brevis TaxID=1393 RepID=UPI000D0FC192|nr:hypothetical protein [Brevibacillus brevis]PSJ67471.1 hypothetical protein C7J99_20990 [Brevibacillus brevis]RED28460.1 hypothetical protein DES34_108327 [Brevibacillus brevis]GEC90714.1 hypothetical protein BBR01nite_30450 [Brevibacillus brevis]VEF91155.1 Uncharacterised protein [Brevibacillus brevis]
MFMRKVFKSKREVREYLLELGSGWKRRHYELEGSNYTYKIKGHHFTLVSKSTNGRYEIFKDDDNEFAIRWYDVNNNWRDREYSFIDLERMIDFIWKNRRGLEVYESFADKEYEYY